MQITTCLLVLCNQSGAESCQSVSSLSAYEHLYFDLELFELELPLQFLSYLDMTQVCKSHCIGDSLINPIYGCSVKITPDINPIYVGIERSFPYNSKNVSFVNMGLV